MYSAYNMLANGGHFNRWCQAFLSSSSTANGALKCWLLEGQSSNSSLCFWGIKIQKEVIFMWTCYPILRERVSWLAARVTLPLIQLSLINKAFSLHSAQEEGLAAVFSIALAINLRNWVAEILKGWKVVRVFIYEQRNRSVCSLFLWII